MEKLIEGNKCYLTAMTNPGDVSPQIRQVTCDEGQSPYAIVITCSDSRVIPESIFSAGIGELFVIRVAGNVMDNHQLGSVGTQSLWRRWCSASSGAGGLYQVYHG